MSIILSITILLLIIVVHELGHFLTAKAFKMKTPDFNVGFGPSIIALRVYDTWYHLRLLPFGGYVTLPGIEKGERPLARLAVIFAGPLFNFVFAFIILTALYLFKMDIGGREYTVTPFQSIAHIMTAITQSFAGISSDDLSAVGLNTAVGQTMYSFGHTLFFIATFNILVGLFNLLPIPPLDGGWLVAYIFESTTKRKIPEAVFKVFAILLILFTIIVLGIGAYNDIAN